MEKANSSSEMYDAAGLAYADKLDQLQQSIAVRLQQLKDAVAEGPSQIAKLDARVSEIEQSAAFSKSNGVKK